MVPKRRRTTAAALVFAIIWIVAPSHRVVASEHCEKPAARVVSVFGTVEHRTSEKETWRQAQLDVTICPTDLVRTGAQSRAAIVFLDTDTVLRIDQNTTLRVRTSESAGKSFLELVKGIIQFFSRTPHALEVDTPFVNAAVEGTEFYIDVASDRTLLTVFEGRIAARNARGSITLTDGKSLVANRDSAPQLRTVVRPRDAVQWALYYPPVLSGRDRAGSSESVREAAELLAAGRVSEAAAKLRAAGDTAPALALRAVIAVAQNDKATALARGRAAVSADPNSGAARIALSYALQTSFDLEAARNLMREAVARRPEDALAWARLAELHLSLGEREIAVEAAAKAAQISPDVSRMNTVLGFAALAQIDIDEAASAFARAIRQDPQDPLPRLGLGLARIRQGNLAEGRREIEIATALDPGSSINRSYMGKAYFEEGSDVFAKGYFDDFFEQRRFVQASKQFEIAKELDPKDPTAWLYDALRKQSQNDPVGALQDIRRSIELNDKRAVYRSSQLLDRDRAARGASLARIYHDLGFEQLGIREASRSLNVDPANAAAHRFLSDSYKDVRRREIARVSELLQAQLLQDVNVNPVQPSLTETNLNIAGRGGPAELGFNEFTPLFERNQAQLDITGQVGNNDTRAGEGVISAVYDRVSMSFGAFRFDTDGFRANNDLEHEIYSGFVQAALTPDLNVQAEVRRRDSKSGDLAINFDPDQFVDQLTQTLDHDIARIGVRYSPTPSSDILVSYIYSDRKETNSQTVPFPFPFTDLVVDAKVEENGYQLETQYLYRGAQFNLRTGVAFNEVDTERLATRTGGPFPPASVTTSSTIKHPHGYFYANVNIPMSVTWTAGISIDDYSEGSFQVQEISPKLGVQWNVTDYLRLRAAAFQTVKPPLVSNRTIEPTSIAGFNQYFDDANATKSRRYGAAADWQITNNVSAGAAASWRDLDQPVLQGTTFITEDRDEQLHRAYLYWTPVSDLALSGELVYDLYKSGQTINNNRPRRVETISVPLGVRYFRPSGFFVGASATYVTQKVERSQASSLADGSDNFVVVDAAIGWRLPKRLGVISLQVKNLFDSRFEYQDDSYREFRFESQGGPYIPDRLILGRVSLNF